MATHRANTSRGRAKAAVDTANDDISAATTKSREAAAKRSSGTKPGADAEPKSVASTTKTAAKAKWLNASLTSVADAKVRKRTTRNPDEDSLDEWVNAPADHTDLAEPSLTPTPPEPAPKSPPAFARPTKRARIPKPTTPAAASGAKAKAVEAKTSPTAPTLEPPKPANAPSEVGVSSNSTARAPATAAAPPPSFEGPANPFGFGIPYPMPNIEALARNIASAIEHASKAFAAYMRPRESGEIKTTIAEEVGEMVRSLGHVAEYYMADPKRAIEAQTAYATQFVNLWAATLQRFQGGAAKPVAEPDDGDKRFSDAEWRDNPFFDFLKQAYVLTTDWAENLVHNADEMEPHRRAKARFYLKQVAAAFSPSNFLGTNPELLRATLAESGENLVRGLKMLAEDIEAGKGNVRIRQVDARAFQLGVNMATTPGKVVFRNDLIELIQYAPTTPEVYKRPLLIFPPWINKFYILDLNPEKSFIRWAVSQGLTVFVVSWVNPDASHADKDFDAYMREGILTALDGVEQATGERKVTAVGYCVGGTLLAATLGYMAATGDDRIESVTFLTTQIDFTDAGDLKVFVDAEQLKQAEKRMEERGYLEGSAMAQAFNMLRPNDLIWSYYVNNYLKGKEPMPFDLLVWNEDSTRMPAANHKFYLRHCYFQNDLSNKRMKLGGRTIDLKKVTIPVYELAAKEDHIAPARSAFNGAKCLGGPVRYVMAGSGHIAGVINPPTKPKYQYWTGGPVEGEFEDWVKAAKETPGSWWPDWIAWVTAQAPEKVPARTPGDGKLKPLGDAPGEYVRIKS
jgi:polyhydroxyalkanoate synthase